MQTFWGVLQVKRYHNGSDNTFLHAGRYANDPCDTFLLAGRYASDLCDTFLHVRRYANEPCDTFLRVGRVINLSVDLYGNLGTTVEGLLDPVAVTEHLAEADVIAFYLDDPAGADLLTGNAASDALNGVDGDIGTREEALI